MTTAEYCALPTCPSNYPDELRALWWASKADWQKAHDLVEGLSSPEAAWIHAYLHRWEGDTGNARYWYNRANKPVCTDALNTERIYITQCLLDYYSA
jgi:hypothetical protein